MRRSFKLLLGALILFGWLAPAALASQQDNPPKEQTTPKQDAKDAGKSAKKAVKKTGSATKKESKKVANKAAQKTEQGSNKVEQKTEPDK